ncbi:SDR family oxidoreductase [Rhabdothermincola sediminis]|uniref:SDR family oxidoreductase n=1 Tax=Rhabdothermincola sediminis TaxID=2751370 RepID=UPI001AA07160|nr:SDR family oxidoreductase [Rhabdothermincola sediminis]
MSRLCEGRVCIVTGAGRGIGREHALMLAEHGAKLVVNDLGGSMSGEGASSGPAQEVVEEIRAAGGEAVANTDDVSDWDGAARLVAQAIDEFGRLDVLVNNAGILRDRMLVNMTEAEWDAVIKVHLKGTAAPSHHAAAYWRDRSKAGEDVDARIINTSSPSGIYGNPGQTNYGAAKAGIAAFTVIASMELARYGVTVNAIAPAALTRMTENLGMGQAPEEVRQQMAPRWIAPIVTWLASSESRQVTGRVFDVSGRRLGVAEGWHIGPSETPVDDPTRMGPLVADLLARARPNADMAGNDRTD